jgi:hypothetical protein
MPDRLFYPLTVLVVAGLIYLASVYPQGQGARSPKPFGHATWAQTHPKKPPSPDDNKPKIKGPF